MESGGVEILLVEDEPADRELTLPALRKANLAERTLVVGDGEEALDFIFCRGPYCARSFADAPKLVLLDLRLSKVSGLEVLRQVKSDPRTKTIPMVILTSSREQKDLLDSYNLGANSLIYKATKFAEFEESIRQAGTYWLLVNQPLCWQANS